MSTKLNCHNNWSKDRYWIKMLCRYVSKIYLYISHPNLPKNNKSKNNWRAITYYASHLYIHTCLWVCFTYIPMYVHKYCKWKFCTAKFTTVGRSFVRFVVSWFNSITHIHTHISNMHFSRIQSHTYSHVRHHHIHLYSRKLTYIR